MAKAHPPHHELHPMKALFVICKENAPELDSHFSKNIRDFVSLCLNKDPEFVFGDGCMRQCSLVVVETHGENSSQTQVCKKCQKNQFTY